MLLFFTNCSDQQIVSDEPAEEPAPEEVVTSNINFATEKAVDFDWEAHNNILYNRNNIITYVTLPWIPQTSLAYISTRFFNLAKHNKKYDGWRLLYNTFLTEQIVNQNPFFILYNEFTGIMRVHLFIPRGVSVRNSFTRFSAGLRDPAKGSSMFNFSKLDFAFPNDVKLSQPEFADLRRTGVLTGSNWHVFEFELAYDPSLTQAATSGEGLPFFLQVTGIKEQNLMIDGRPLDNIRERIVMVNEGSSTSFLNRNLRIGSAEQATINRQWDLRSTIDLFVNSQVDGSVNLAEPLQSFLSDHYDNRPLANLDLVAGLSNSFSTYNGQSDLSSTTYLSADVSVPIRGQISEEVPVMASKFTLPGTGSTADDFTQPLYNKPLGVFNLASAPEVQWDDFAITESGSSKQVSQVKWDGDVDYIHEYRLNKETIDLQFNPEIDAEIVEAKTKLFYDNRVDDGNSLIREFDKHSGELLSDGTFARIVEGAGTISLIDQNTDQISGPKFQSRPNSGVFVKLFLTIRSTNGTNQTYHLVKSYKPRFTKVDLQENLLRNGESIGR